MNLLFNVGNCFYTFFLCFGVQEVGINVKHYESVFVPNNIVIFRPLTIM